PFEEFGVFLARFNDKQLGLAMMDPHPTRLDEIKYCQVYLGRYVAYIKTDTRPPSDEFSVFTMKPDQPLCILARDMQRSKELPIMREVVTSSMQKKNRSA